MAADLTGEFRLKIGEPHVIAPAVGNDHNGMRTFAIAAIDEEPRWSQTNASRQE
jgi:hypothetical protein